MAIIGTVGINNFDSGMIFHLDAAVQECTRLNGDKFRSFVTSIPNVTGPKECNYKVPVKIVPVDTKYYPDLIPSIAIRPTGPTFADDRLGTYHLHGRAGKIPSPGAKPLTVTISDGSVVEGYSKYTTREAALPFDFTYDIITMAPTREIAIAMFIFLLRKIPKYSSISISDGTDEKRTYELMLDSTSENSELVSVAERNISYTFSVKILGEIDVYDDVDNQSAQQISVDIVLE